MFYATKYVPTLHMVTTVFKNACHARVIVLIAKYNRLIAQVA